MKKIDNKIAYNMKVFEIVMICSFFYGIQSMYIVHQVKCFDEKECGIKFYDFLNSQKRIFAQATEEIKGESSIEEESRKKSNYFNLDHSKAPGFGMSILFNDNKLEGNNKEKEKKEHYTVYIGEIYSFSKLDEDHTEKALLEELILDLSFKLDEIRSEKGEKSNLIIDDEKLELDYLKKINGAIYIYVNNSPCIFCLERYEKILNKMNIKFYIYYTNTYTLKKIPSNKNESKKLSNLKIYKDCDTEINEKKETRKKNKLKNEKIFQTDDEAMVDCINRKIQILYNNKKGNIQYKKININSIYIPRLRALKTLLNLNEPKE